MEKSWFRLSICLKHFFADERAQCYVSAERHRPVRWLRRRLLRLFGAPLRDCEGSTFALTCRGHLLPDDEPLALLCHDDLIVAVPVQFKIPSEGDDLEKQTQGMSTSDAPTPMVGNIECFNAKHCPKTDRSSNIKSTISYFTCGNITTKNESLHKEVNFDSTSESAFGKAEHEHEIIEVTANNECEESSDLKRLQDVKQRAFNLLDQYNRDEDDPITSPKRKRRRVRKRRQPRDVTEGHNEAEQSLNDFSESCEKPVVDLEERDMHMEPVARNTSLEVRPARLVQSLTVDFVS